MRGKLKPHVRTKFRTTHEVVMKAGNGVVTWSCQGGVRVQVSLRAQMRVPLEAKVSSRRGWGGLGGGQSKGAHSAEDNAPSAEREEGWRTQFPVPK